MPPNPSPLAHKDVQKAMDRALANGRGIRIRCASYGEANALRQRMYTMRKADRRENARIYDHTDPLHGRSVYDSLICTPMQDVHGVVHLVVEVSTPERLESRIEDLASEAESPVTKEQVESAIRSCNDATLTDEQFWRRVHESLGLNYGDLFPLMEQLGVEL